MTQPPVAPMPPAASQVPVAAPIPDQAPYGGLDDLDVGDPTDAPWANEEPLPLNADGRDPRLDPDGMPLSAEAARSLKAEAEATEAPKKKSHPRTASKVTPIDWTKMTPRKEDDFAGAPISTLPPTVEKLREFLNTARANGWHGLYYPVLEFENRNTASANVTKLNAWRKAKSNRFGVRNGETLGAKCETQAKDKYVLWVALLVAEGTVVPEGFTQEAE